MSPVGLQYSQTACGWAQRVELARARAGGGLDAGRSSVTGPGDGLIDVLIPGGAIPASVALPPHRDEAPPRPIPPEPGPEPQPAPPRTPVLLPDESGDT